MALARFEAQNKSASTQSDHQLTVVSGDGGGQGCRVGSGFLGTTPALLRPGGGPAAFTASHCTLINGDDHLGMGSRRMRCAVDRRASPCTTYLPLDLRARTQPLRQRVRRSSPRRNLRRPSIPPPRPPEARMSPSHASARSKRGPCGFSRRRGGEGSSPHARAPPVLRKTRFSGGRSDSANARNLHAMQQVWGGVRGRPAVR